MRTHQPRPDAPARAPGCSQVCAERAQLERSGWQKSAFDLMIACTAIEHEAALVTHDAALKEGAIGGLVVEDWLDFSL